MGQAVSTEHDIARTYALLGGRDTIRKPIRNSMEAHDLLMLGLPSAALLHLTSQATILTADTVLGKAIGISLRTLQRRQKDAPDAVLSVDQSNRIWKFAEILGQAAEIFGSKAAAEAWLNATAIGLNQRRPINLLSTAVGVGAVEDYLTRIEYGVYAWRRYLPRWGAKTSASGDWARRCMPRPGMPARNASGLGGGGYPRSYLPSR